MARVYDVAAFILSEHGPMTAMKLQKLVYYVQAWSLVWDERPLFNERIEAWANGPVSPDLYSAHRGYFIVKPGDISGRVEDIDDTGKETIRAVLGYYGDKSPQWLSDLTHAEAPWRDARQGLPPNVRSNEEITPAAMAEYYGSLPAEA
ncbi:MAG: DUF4065 domain-containing protein [Alsobacter sp.]